MWHLLRQLAPATPAQHHFWYQGHDLPFQQEPGDVLPECLVTLPGQGQHTRQQHKQRMVCGPLIGWEVVAGCSWPQ